MSASRTAEFKVRRKKKLQNAGYLSPEDSASRGQEEEKLVAFDEAAKLEEQSAQERLKE